jgi:hypothetical protein
MSIIGDVGRGVAMPNILLFGCHEQLVATLASDDRWSVAIGLHEEGENLALAAPTTPLPDPRHWNLVIDDCGKDNPALPPSILEQHRLSAHIVSDGYLRECERAHGIRLCSRREHTLARVGLFAPAGHKTLEFNASGDSRAVHLMDFVEEFETSFAAHRIRRFTVVECTYLFADAYDDPVILLIEDAFAWLCLINIPHADRRNEALRYLCYRTAPKLWPDIYSDSFQPRRVLALMEDKDKVIAERRQLEEEIEKQIQDEQAFYAPFVNLPYLGNDALKQLVQRVFEDVFDIDAEDLDKKLEEGEPKRLDLLVRFPDASALVEVRARGTRNAQIDDVEQFDDNYERSNERFGPADVKIFIFNGMYWRSHAERTAYPAFSDDVVSEATKRGIGLISAFQLLEVIEAFRNEDISREQVIEALSRPGLFEIPS